jgi:DNA ligase D-like protein (predicted polymerase)
MATIPTTVEFPRALEARTRGSHWYAEVDGTELKFSNLDKVFWGPEGHLKGDLVAYYLNIAPTLLPYLRDRALTLKRMPDGADGDFFYEKQAPAYTPEWLRRVPITSREGSSQWGEPKRRTVDYLLADDARAVLWLANLGCIEFHPWHSRVDDIGHPDYAFFDLDPMEVPFATVREVALLVRTALDRLGLRSYPRTSGATGIQIYVPLDRVHSAGRKWLLAGLLLALAAFFAALVYVFRLSRQLMSVERARQAVWLVAAYPFAVYYGAPYTESFYLLGAVATFFHASRAEYGRAAAWGFFLALCRPNGFFIALPVAIIVARQVWADKRVSAGAIAACVAPGFGVLAYTIYLYARFGDGLVWMKGQEAWGRVFVGLGPSLRALFFDRFNVIANEGWEFYLRTNPYDFIYTCTAIFVLASLWPTARRFGPAYPVFVAINILPPLLMGGMMSIGRMTSVLFPAFLWLAAAVPERYLTPLVVAFAVGQGLVAALFFTWRPVF